MFIVSNFRKGEYIMTKPKYHMVSFSGGKDSTAMLLHMMELGMQIDEVLYCDTWMEFPAMERHVKRIKKLIEDAGIKFVTLKYPMSFKYLMLEHQPERRQSTQEKLGGNPKGYSWPGSRSRWCTSKLKTDIIKKYKQEMNDKYDVIEYVGIAVDEQYRLERESNKVHQHPLVDWNWTEADALKYCYDKGFDWEGLYEIFDRVSCWCCPLQPLKDLKGLWKNFPDLWNELNEMDKQTWRTFRADYSVDELTARFELEEQLEAEGKSINPHNKEFRKSWNKVLSKLRK